MNRIGLPWALLLALTSAFAPAVQAQAHPLTTPELHELASQHSNAVAVDRARVAEFLAQPTVRDAVEAAGLDFATVEHQSQLLGGTALEEVASRIRQLEEEEEGDLVGGANTIVISTTTLIIALLVLILITD